MKTKSAKQEEAKVRQEAHNKLSPQEKINKLDERFGIGHHATEERKKLNALHFTEEK